MKIRKLFLASILSFSMAGQCISPVFAQEEKNDEEVEEVVEETLEQEVPEILEDVEEVETPEESQEDEQKDNEVIEEEIEQENVKSGTCGEVSWLLSDAGVLTISGTGKMDDLSTKEYPWYSYRNSIKTVIIKDDVENIGRDAFYSYGNITYLYIGNSVQSIGSDAFSCCTGLTNVTIPGNVEKIGAFAFSEDTNISSLTLSNGIKEIDNLAFDSCSSLTSISIPASVTSIGGNAFGMCNKITSVSVDSNNKIYECPSGYNVIIEKSTHVLTCGFANSIIPYGVTEIGKNAFYGLENLSIVIPASVTIINNCAFEVCTINCISIPISVTEICTSAFYKDFQSYTTVKKVYYAGSVEQFNSIYFERTKDKNILTGNITYNTSGVCGDSVYWNVIGNQLFIFGTGPMYGFTIQYEPWYEYRNTVTSVNIGSGITNVGYAAFFNFSKLKNVVFPETLTTISSFAFDGCKSLTSVTIPKNVTSLGTNPFIGCTSLTSLKVESDNPKYDSRNNCNAIIDSKTHTILVGTKNTVFEGSIYTVGSYAFDQLDLGDIVIPKSITRIESYGFYGCNINSITFRKTTRTIESKAFNNTDIRTVYLYKNTTEDSFLKNDYILVYLDKTVSFAGHSLSLTGLIKLNYFIDLSDDIAYDSTSYVEFTLPNGTKQKSAIPPYSSNGHYQFSVKVSTKEMTDTITAKIISGGTVLKTETYSIQQYANSILNDTTGTYDVSTKNIVKTMLTYGYYTQKYFNYHTTNLPTGINTLTNYDFGTWYHVVSEKDSSVKFVGARLVLASSPKLKLYFTGNSTFTIKVPLTPTYTVTKEGKYTVMTIDITDYCKTSYLISADDEKFSLIYHPYSYGYAANRGTNQHLKNMMSAFYAYYNLFRN